MTLWFLGMTWGWNQLSWPLSLPSLTYLQGVILQFMIHGTSFLLMHFAGNGWRHYVAPVKNIEKIK